MSPSDQILEVNDGRCKAAVEIVREHNADEIEQIPSWCEPEMATLIHTVLKKHGRKTAEPSLGDRFGYSAPMRRPQRRRS